MTKNKDISIDYNHFQQTGKALLEVSFWKIFKMGNDALHNGKLFFDHIRSEVANILTWYSLIYLSKYLNMRQRKDLNFGL